MKDLGITTGEWKVIKYESSCSVWADDKIVCSSALVSYNSSEEIEANLKLNVDAGNTAQKCGLLPSELLAEVEELRQWKKEQILVVEPLLEAARKLRADNTAELKRNKESMKKVLFTAWNVIAPDELHKYFGVIHQNKFGHHSTVVFGEQKFDLRESQVTTLPVIGRLTTDRVDVLLVENEESSNKHPHITLSTAPGVKPFESNAVINNNLGCVMPLKFDYGVDVIFRNNY